VHVDEKKINNKRKNKVKVKECIFGIEIICLFGLAFNG
jgi:hypothetical protein